MKLHHIGIATEDIENLVGTKLDNDAEQEGIQFETYKIPDELKRIFEEKR